ncbi:TraB/VirB10 family protein [Pseudoalteromonas luteoviolacea]|uniref:TraB/VirB10 family protein n=1 Tax=Pseudoalteromonas luteoviolacea TaxID=43657 RepID=UPI001B388C6A|nr:TraB/VirB10 family protein [Pseudoalteromonas luteoviolacea]MBQ4839839.1 TraB/VirB10 family protein [Pseudoalteromonas luteoviolacea]
MNWMRKKWDELDSTTKQKCTTGCVVIVVLLLSTVLYYGSGEAEERGKEKTVLLEEDLNLGKDLLKDDIQEKVKTDLEQQNGLIGQQNGRLERLEEVLPAIQEELARLKTSNLEPEHSIESVQQQGSAYQDVQVTEQTSYPSVPGYNGTNFDNQLPEEKAEIIGGVGHNAGEPQEQADDEKKENGFYLAPGFMEAQLLHGIEAYTSEGAMANPEPLMIRVQAPAVLPNNIKAQLAGCFVMANAHGSLGKERVESQVVNLSCLSPDGTAVIDQEVLGYVVGSDGKKGLPANIVTKMGQHVTRSFVAGMFGGAGEAISLSSLENNITGAGQVQTFDSDKIGQSALGRGLKDATQDLKKLFIELARQTMPVAEVGAAAKCTVVLQKGVHLKIRQIKNLVKE